MTTHDPRWSPRPLLALFAALLAGCTGREVPEQSIEETEGASTSSSSPGDPATASTTDTSGTDTGTGSTSVPGTVSDPTYEPPECVYADHLIVLTPEEYEAWLHGDATTGDTT
ncbi:MAG TPA: hypothetical protein VGB85_19550, partial [Nannocystis sp.]